MILKSLAHAQESVSEISEHIFFHILNKNKTMPSILVLWSTKGYQGSNGLEISLNQWLLRSGYSTGL